jgi:hypothetical protein
MFFTLYTTNEGKSNGWGATAIDAFDTAIIMELIDVVDTILNFIPTIDFSYSATQVSVFETNVRCIGGILSGTQIAFDISEVYVAN